jgi:integrase
MSCDTESAPPQRDRTYTIGDARDWRTTDARAKAKQLKRNIDDGGDPCGDIKAEREAPDMAELCQRFETEHMQRLRETTRVNYLSLVKLHVLPFLGEHRKVSDVRFSDVDALHRKLTKAGVPYVANRCIAMMSKMFSLAIRWEMIASNPAKGIERNDEAKRRRYLSSDGTELARLTQALTTHPDQQAANVIRLLMLTGCRKGEALSARWADLDLTGGTWSKPASAVKQARNHSAPLSAPARALLSKIREEQAKLFPHRLPEYVFAGRFGRGHRSSIKRGWATICKAAGITGLRIHDLRHSFASQLVSSGHSLALIGALLGHSNVNTTHRYAHLYDDPQRAAVEKIGVLIENANKPVAEPIKLKGRR